MNCLREVICGIGAWINGETLDTALSLVLGKRSRETGRTMAV